MKLTLLVGVMIIVGVASPGVLAGYRGYDSFLRSSEKGFGFSSQRRTTFFAPEDPVYPFNCVGDEDISQGEIFDLSGNPTSLAAVAVPGRVVVFGSATCPKWSAGQDGEGGLQDFLTAHPLIRAVEIYGSERHAADDPGPLPVYTHNGPSCSDISTNLRINEHNDIWERINAAQQRIAIFGQQPNNLIYVEGMDEIPSQEHNARPYRIGVVCADKKIKFMPPINPVCQTVKSWLESQF